MSCFSPAPFIPCSNLLVKETLSLLEQSLRWGITGKDTTVKSHVILTKTSLKSCQDFNNVQKDYIIERLRFAGVKECKRLQMEWWVCSLFTGSASTNYSLRYNYNDESHPSVQCILHCFTSDFSFVCFSCFSTNLFPPSRVSHYVNQECKKSFQLRVYFHINVIFLRLCISLRKKSNPIPGLPTLAYE